jgi:hypothetical protein
MDETFDSRSSFAAELHEASLGDDALGNFALSFTEDAQQPTREFPVSWSGIDSPDHHYHVSHVASTEQVQSDMPFLSQSERLQTSTLTSMHNCWIPDEQYEVNSIEQVAAGAAMASSLPKKDGRGRHWKDKAQQGEASPNPSEGSKEWKEKVQSSLCFTFRPLQ